MTELDFRQLVDGATELVGVVDRAQRLVYANDAFRRATGAASVEPSASFNEPARFAPGGALGAALARVLRTGDGEALEDTLDGASGRRRYAVRIARLDDDRAVLRLADITELQAGRLVTIAARAMRTGMAIVEAPSGRVLFVNDATTHVFGAPSRAARGKDAHHALAAYDVEGRRLRSGEWPIARAIEGETILGHEIDVEREGMRRRVRITAAPVRDAAGAVFAAVSTYEDITEVTRAHQAATYLASVGPLLERFDPETSLQAVVDLAVPALADWCLVHLAAPGQPPRIAAVATTSDAHTARVRSTPGIVSPDTPLGRVLGGGAPELFEIDAQMIERATRDPEHRALLESSSLRSAVVAPLTGQAGVLGAITFALRGSGRTYQRDDLDILVELARRTGIALDNARLLASEQQARRNAEHARDRTRRLQTLTARLSGALERSEVVDVMVSAGRDALGAGAGFAWLLRDDGALDLASCSPAEARPSRAFELIAAEAAAPIRDVLRTGRPMVFERPEDLLRAYPTLAAEELSRFAAWAMTPILVRDRTLGAVTFAFTVTHTFTEDDLALLAAIVGQTSLALERCTLLEAERMARAEAEASRTRERQLHALAGRLSSALTPPQVAAIVCEEVRSVLRGRSCATVARVDDHVEVIGTSGPEPGGVSGLATVPLDASLPVTQAVRSAALVWCATETELADRYADFEALWRDHGTRAWGAVPFTFEGRTVGALALEFDHEHPLGEGEREFLYSAGQIAAQALERARLFEALQRNYQTLREQNEQLEAAFERAALADRRKDEFLAMLGHELRNPLAPIVTALALMARKSNGTLQRERDVIARQVDHLTKLVDDLLDVSRITRGKVQLTRSVLEIAHVLGKAIEMVGAMFEKRAQRLLVDVPPTGLLVDADATRLAQVFQNLLTNATKYSDPRTVITVRAGGDEDRVWAEIRDEGIGISEELRPRLFEMFAQGERALDRAEGGLGLGLTIAKSLCELHGGDIAVASDGPGRGTTFTITLPRARRRESQRLPRASRAPLLAARSVRVLVVDDNVDAALTLHEYLSARGHEARVAHDGLAALDLASTFKPAIAVLDIGLPVMDGYELARKLREQHEGGPLRLVAVTGYGQDRDRDRARDAGFDHHLVKPIALDNLVTILEG